MVENKYKVGHPEFLEEAKRLGLSGFQYHQKLIRDGILVKSSDIDKKYRNELVRKKGFNDINEYQRDRFHDRGIYFPMSENEDCSAYLGVYIAEKILLEIFKDIKIMPYGHPGYDFICKGYKVDCKISCLAIRNGWIGWEFEIDYNRLPDYFILVAFNNREEFGLMHLWLIRKNEIIRGKKFYRRKTFRVTDKTRYLLEIKRYELTDKLEHLREYCHKLRDDMLKDR